MSVKSEKFPSLYWGLGYISKVLSKCRQLEDLFRVRHRSRVSQLLLRLSPLYNPLLVCLQGPNYHSYHKNRLAQNHHHPLHKGLLLLYQVVEEVLVRCQLGIGEGTFCQEITAKRNQQQGYQFRQTLFDLIIVCRLYQSL